MTERAAKPIPGWSDYLRILLLLAPVACGADGESPSGPGSSVVRVVRVTPARDSVMVGQSVRFTALALDQDGASMQAASAAVVWSTSAAAIAVVAADGTATGLAPGVATISATVQSVSGTASLTVREPPRTPTRVEIVGAGDSIYVGDTLRLRARVLDQKGEVIADQHVQWSVSDESVATISSAGLVRGVGRGEARITATIGSVTNTASVFVKPPPVATVDILRDSVVLRVGASDSLPVLVRDGGGRTLSVEVAWSSSDSRVVEARAGGWVVARGTGRARVWARAGTASDSVEVSVARLTGLSQADSSALSRHLDLLSTGWVQSSVDGANQILSGGRYGTDQWEGFFRAYFATRPFTNPLREYLVYPVFWWFGEEVNRRLQEALLPVLSDQILATSRGHASTFERVLAQDPILAETVSNSAVFLTNYLSEQGRLRDLEALERLWERLLADAHAVVFGQVSPHRSLRRIRAAVLTGLYEARPRTASRLGELVSLLRLDGRQREMIADFDVLVDTRWAVYRDDGSVEAGSLTGRHMQVLHDHLTLMPSIAKLRYIIGEDAWGLFPGSYHCCYASRFGSSSLVSIGTMDIESGWLENTFPSDVAPREVPVFVSIWIHEFHHVVDFALQQEPWYAVRSGELVAQAGTDPMNYLRSMIAAGFFVDHPGEFLASASQMYVVDSGHTLTLALQRFEAGRPEPLNQFLFLAEIFSQGQGRTWFYVADRAGGLVRQSVLLGRDARGHIAWLVVNGATYSFDRNAKGNVQAVTVR